MSMSEQNKPAWRNPVRARLEAGEFVVGVTITRTTSNWALALGFHFLWGNGTLARVARDAAGIAAARGLRARNAGPGRELWTASEAGPA
jgi:hypothetical protein